MFVFDLLYKARICILLFPPEHFMELFATVTSPAYNAGGYELNIKSTKLYLVYDRLYIYKF